MSFDEPFLDDSGNWAGATAAYQAGLAAAQQWEPDARTALVEPGEYPPAHLTQAGEWEIQYWSPGARKGLNLYLSKDHQVLRQEEWGAFYQQKAVEVGSEILGPQGFVYVPEISRPGPDSLSFVFRRPSPTYAGQNDFVDLQISTSVMLMPPPRRLNINLVRNTGDRPMFGQGGGYETRLGAILPDKKLDYWWPFKDEAEYEAQLRETFGLVVKYGLAALM
ncbi:MAG: hypothetical protein J0I20_11350 [Chloroflexi bacterium]|nr:hypothetical protein [Chloroflexota bacterium]OJV92338.1 MAG: hypothetical protein BGO39_30870 [Chloroflexi bacterium 54-19]